MIAIVPTVIPAQAGIQSRAVLRAKRVLRPADAGRLDSRLRGNDRWGWSAFSGVALSIFLATPTLATEWVHCNDTGGAASFDYLADDGLGVLQVAAITVTAGEKVWASDPANGPGDPVMLGQGFEDADSVSIDAVAPDYAPVAQLRLFKANEADGFAMGGTLSVTGQGAWAVTCDAGTE